MSHAQCGGCCRIFAGFRGNADGLGTAAHFAFNTALFPRSTVLLGLRDDAQTRSVVVQPVRYGFQAASLHIGMGGGTVGIDGSGEIVEDAYTVGGIRMLYGCRCAESCAVGADARHICAVGGRSFNRLGCCG